ncbi:MAG TPA: Tat pathway signal protein, partial [bacterium]|nr:Tat pathway signal protein [bacterium]
MTSFLPPGRVFSYAAWAVILLASGSLSACRHAATPIATQPAEGKTFAAADEAFLEDVQERTFRFFWDLAVPQNGLIPDRWPQRSFASISATGFGLTAYPIGVEHGWITREQARDRVLLTLQFLWNAPQHERNAGATGYHG